MPEIINVDFFINGVKTNPPVNWQEILIINNFDSQEGQREISIDAFRFANEEAQIIRNIIDSGGIFQGVPFSLVITKQGNLTPFVFNGYLNLPDVLYNNISDISVPIGGLDIIDDIEKRLQGITFLLLKEQGFITNSDYTDVNVIIEKEFIAADFAILAVTTYLMTKETLETAKTLNDRIAQLISADPLNPAKVAALVVLDLIYFAAMLIATVKLFKEVFNAIYPQKKTEKGITFLMALTKTFQYLGFTFLSSINDLNWVYLPSKSELSTSNDGIPNPEDVGYTASEMVNLCKDMFNASLYIDRTKKEVRLVSLNDPFWMQSSSFVMLDHLDEIVAYNTNEIVQTRLVSFEVDSTDFHTLENYKGTSYEINTELITPPTNPEFKTLKGYDQVRIPLVLCVRKDKLNIIEQTLKVLASVIDAVSRVLGGKSNLSGSVKNRVGMLKKGQKYHAKPKVVILDNGSIPSNYRDLQSAKYLYDNYINFKSLVSNDFQNQKRIYKDRKRYMDFDSFMKATQNKYFTTSDGKIGEFTRIEWAFDLDYCTCDYAVREVYSRNLKESFIEID